MVVSGVEGKHTSRTASNPKYLSQNRVINYFTPTVGFFLLLLLQRHECLWSGRIGDGGWGRGVQISSLYVAESSPHSLSAPLAGIFTMEDEGGSWK